MMKMKRQGIDNIDRLHNMYKAASEVSVPRDSSPICVAEIGFYQQFAEAHSYGNALNGRYHQTKKASRNVRFAVDLNLNDKIIFIEPKSVLTEQDRKNCWWSRQETLAMCRDAKNVAKMFRDGESFSSREFNQFFKFCNLATSKRKLRDNGLAKLLESLQDAGCRGLERTIYPILDGYRIKYVQAMVTVQAKIPIDATPEIRERLLHAMSVPLSKPSRTMAKLMAQCDSREVTLLLKHELQAHF